MKIKTSELTGVALDWAVAKCEGATDLWFDTVATYWVKLNGEDRALRYGWAGMSYLPSTDWAQGGPIIDRECISVIRADDDFGTDEDGYCNNVRIPVWCADRGQQSTTTSTEYQSHDAMFQFYASEVTFGHTPLIAAMRCYVSSKLGNEVEIPEGLMK
jgi:hypothetical protein